MKIPLIDKHDFNIHVRRRKPNGPDKNDKAAVIKEEDTEQEMLLMKSDGAKFPKPSESKIETVDKPRILHRLFGGHNYVKQVEMMDQGDGNCSYLDLENEDGEWNIVGTADNRLVETSRSISSQKYAQIFEEEDNTQLWLAAYLSVLAFATVGAMWMVTNGMEETIAQATKQGVQSGLNAASNAQGAAP